MLFSEVFKLKRFYKKFVIGLSLKNRVIIVSCRQEDINDILTKLLPYLTGSFGLRLKAI